MLTAKTVGIVNWYLARNYDAFGGNGWVLCGDVYDGESFVAYLQIHIKTIKKITKSGNTYTLYVKNLVTHEDREVVITSETTKQDYENRLNRIKEIKTIRLMMIDMDKYFRKKKRLRKKQTDGFLKLYQYSTSK